MRTLRLGPRLGFTILAALSVCTTLVPDAHARRNPSGPRRRGTFFVLELDTGFSEAAYAGAMAGPKLGASAGITVRLPHSTLRWYLLGSASVAYSTARTNRRGITTDADREDLDLFVANRLVFPVWRGLRLYGELGLGRRVIRERIERSDGLGALSSISDEWLLVTALGVQWRLNRRWSLGLRGELTPLGEAPSLGEATAGLLAEPDRLAVAAQLGLHF